jgi:uncharacterized protein YkvS
MKRYALSEAEIKRLIARYFKHGLNNMNMRVYEDAVIFDLDYFRRFNSIEVKDDEKTDDQEDKPDYKRPF